MSNEGRIERKAGYSFPLIQAQLNYSESCAFCRDFHSGIFSLVSEWEDWISVSTVQIHFMLISLKYWFLVTFLTCAFIWCNCICHFAFVTTLMRITNIQKFLHSSSFHHICPEIFEKLFSIMSCHSRDYQSNSQSLEHLASLFNTFCKFTSSKFYRFFFLILQPTHLHVTFYTVSNFIALCFIILSLCAFIRISCRAHSLFII